MTRTHAETDAAAGWGQLAPILVVHLCGTLGFSIGLPFLVFLVADLGGAPWTYGLLGATYSIAQMIGAPVLGRWSDRVGRRAVLLLSQGGTAAAWLLFSFATQLPRDVLGSFAGSAVTAPLLLIFIARFVDGLTGGNVSVANAYVADLTRNDKAARQVAFGRMGMAASVGFTLGPAIAGLLGAVGDAYTGPVVAALAIAIIGVLLCLRLQQPGDRCPDGPPSNVGFLSRLLGHEQRRCDRAPQSLKRGSLSDPAIRFILLATFMMFLAFNVFYAAFPIHATQGLEWSSAKLGLFYSLMSVAMFLVQGPILQFSSKRLPPRRLFALGMLGLVAAFGFYSGMFDVAALIGALLFALGNGLAWPTFQAQMTNSVPESEQGAVQGSVASVSSFASIVGLVAGGILYPHLSSGLFLSSALLFAGVMLMTGKLFPSSKRIAS